MFLSVKDRINIYLNHCFLCFYANNVVGLNYCNCKEYGTYYKNG
ncbi:hypothetical protein ACINWC692_3113 [Acinetobacter baumannii WC-692]|nr:hypothetical protein ACINWC692_3113 [Acinetobacter baumannii WC-692]